MTKTRTTLAAQTKILDIIQTKDKEIEHLQSRIKRLAEDLRMSEEYANKLNLSLVEMTEKNEKTYHKNRAYENQIKELEHSLKFERGRTCQALNVAEEAANAAGSVARITDRLHGTLDSLERKLER